MSHCLQVKADIWYALFCNQLWWYGKICPKMLSLWILPWQTFPIKVLSSFRTSKCNYDYKFWEKWLFLNHRMFFAGYDPVVEPSVDCCKFRISSSFSIQKTFWWTFSTNCINCSINIHITDAKRHVVDLKGLDMAFSLLLNQIM